MRKPFRALWAGIFRRTNEEACPGWQANGEAGPGGAGGSSAPADAEEEVGRGSRQPPPAGTRSLGPPPTGRRCPAG